MTRKFLNFVLCAAALAFAPLSPAADIAIEQGKEKGTITVASFERILKENPSQIAIIDVRDEKDVKKGTFPGATNIPVGDIEKKLAELPKDKPIVFTCSTGARASASGDVPAGCEAFLPGIGRKPGPL
jgi:hypothetical protein